MKIRLDGLSLQLLTLVILPFAILLVAVSLFSVRVHDQAMRSLIAERDQRAARAAAGALSEQLNHREAAVRSLSLHLVEGSSATSLLEGVAFLDAAFEGGLAVFGPRGEIMASSNAADAWESRPHTEFMMKLLAEGHGFSAPFFEGTEVFLMAGAAAGDSVVVGVFSVSSLMQAATLSSGTSTEWSAFLVDGRGVLLANVGEAPNADSLLDHPGVEAALRGEYGSSFLRSGSQDEHVVAFTAVAPLGWALVIEERWEDVRSPLLDISLIAPLALIPALVVTLIALWFGARRVIEPLRRLEEQATGIAAGDFGAIEEPLESIGEIQSLQRKIAWMASQMRQYQQALQRYIGAITAAQEDERGRLARELHDETMQDLIAIDQRVQLAAMDPSAVHPALSASLEKLHEQLQNAVQGLRRMIRGLRPIYLEDLGLVAALEMLAQDVGADVGHPVVFTVDGEVRRLDAPTELAIYRIAQEALSNVSRHAFSQSLEITVTFSRDRFRMRIVDDGVGFGAPNNLGKLGASEHYGLLGMHERAELIGATLNVQSSLGQGTSVEIGVPLPEKAA